MSARVTGTDMNAAKTPKTRNGECNRHRNRQINSDSDPRGNRRGCGQSHKESDEDGSGDCHLDRDGPNDRQENKLSDEERKLDCNVESSRGHCSRSNEGDGPESETGGDWGANLLGNWE
jgi:hypothetical protein